jgi:aryl-alcohol dehydrogenase-like predicted oxidoreductase
LLTTVIIGSVTDTSSLVGNFLLKKIELGHSDLEVGVVGLGCMGMSTAYGSPNDKESIATIQEALDNGCNLIDSSDAYGNGHNEELLGKAFKEGYREKAVLISKFGNLGERGVLGTPKYVMEACEKSLARLQTDVIDLYFVHRIDPNVPIEDTIGAMVVLKEQGKIRYIGLSEAAMGTLRRAHAIHPITALQTEYSLWTRDAESEFLPTARELGISYIAYAPLGRGYLTSKFITPKDLPEGDRRHDHPRFNDENMALNKKLLGTLNEIALAKNRTAAQIAIAWTLHQGGDIIPIPGTKKRNWLRENIAAADIDLNAEECAVLEIVFAPGITAGQRYPDKQFAALNK